jgi:hypothetical protein
MCCKLLEIKALEKPAGQWCQHCSTRKQCDQYLTRPQVCHNFFCAYMTEPGLGEEWKPSTSRMMMTYSNDGNHLFVQVDPTRPDAWRKEPYYRQLKKLAAMNNPNGQQIIVSINDRNIVIFPDREVDIGAIGEQETVRFERVQTPQGPRTEVYKVSR